MLHRLSSGQGHPSKKHIFGHVTSVIGRNVTAAYPKQAISARERALCQLTVCFEFQSRSDRRKKHKSCALEMVFGRKLRR